MANIFSDIYDLCLDDQKVSAFIYGKYSFFASDFTCFEGNHSFQILRMAISVLYFFLFKNTLIRAGPPARTTIARIVFSIRKKGIAISEGKEH